MQGLCGIADQHRARRDGLPGHRADGRIDAARADRKEAADAPAERALHAFEEGRVVERLHGVRLVAGDAVDRSEEHTSELQSLMRNSYAVFCLKKKKKEKR